MTPSEGGKFASIYETHYRHVFAYCRRRADVDQVDDIVAEVFLALWRKIEQAPSDEDALKWLYRTAHLVLNNHWRGSSRKRRPGENLQSIGLEPAPPVPDQIVVREEVREVLQAANRLRPRDIEILRLALWKATRTTGSTSSMWTGPPSPSWSKLPPTSSEKSWRTPSRLSTRSSGRTSGRQAQTVL